jgi:hypothetical protein
MFDRVCALQPAVIFGDIADQIPLEMENIPSRVHQDLPRAGRLVLLIVLIAAPAANGETAAVRSHEAVRAQLLCRPKRRRRRTRIQGGGTAPRRQEGPAATARMTRKFPLDNSYR